MAYYGPLPQPVKAGATGDNTLTSHGVLVGQGTSPVSLISPSATSGIALVSQGASSDPAYDLVVGAGGGTGVNNGSYTVTLGGNISTASSFTTSGANPLTLTTTSTTNVTLPDTGTLATISAFSYYTPTIGDGTNNFTTSIANGYYYLVSGITFYTLDLVWTSKNSASGIIRISLPGTPGVKNAAILYWMEGVTFTGQIWSGCDPPDMYVTLTRTDLSGSMSKLTDAAFASSGEVILSGSFY